MILGREETVEAIQAIQIPCLRSASESITASWCPKSPTRKPLKPSAILT